MAVRLNCATLRICFLLYVIACEYIYFVLILKAYSSCRFFEFSFVYTSFFVCSIDLLFYTVVIAPGLCLTKLKVS